MGSAWDGGAACLEEGCPQAAMVIGRIGMRIWRMTHALSDRHWGKVEVTIRFPNPGNQTGQATATSPRETEQISLEFTCQRYAKAARRARCGPDIRIAAGNIVRVEEVIDVEPRSKPIIDFI